MTAQMKVNKGIDRSPGFNIPDPLSLPSLKGKVSVEEWALRCDLAATYRARAFLDEFLNLLPAR